MFAGTDAEQIKYCFDIYDLNEDGFISKEEIATMMKNCMVKNREEEKEEDGEGGVRVSSIDYGTGGQGRFIQIAFY